MKRKLVIIADALDNQSAGIHVYLKNLLNGIHSLGHNFDITIIRPLHKNEYPKWKTNIVPINYIPGHQRWRQFTAIPRIINSLQPDIVLEPSHFGPFQISKSIKRVTVIHDLTPLSHPQYHKVGSYFAHKLLLPNIIKLSSLILTNSKNTKNDILKRYPLGKGKTRFIHLAPNNISQNDTTTDLAFGKYILSVGTIEPRKNHIQLVEAFERISNLKLKLIIVGSIGWKSKPIIARINNSPRRGQIQILDNVDDHALAGLYKNAILSVYPSHYEGFGLPILESMKFGTPVLCSNSSSMPEVGGAAARYFPLNDPIALAKLIEETIEDSSQLQELRQTSIEWSSNFTWNQTATKTIEALSSICY